MRWFALSTRILTDPKVEQLGEKHGPAGPLVWISLLANAGLQEMGGEVEITYRQLAHEVFIDRDQAKQIVDDAIEAGLCHAMSRDVTGCLLAIKAWEKHQAAYRKAKSRAGKKEAKKPHGQANVTDCHAMSRDVTDKTRQDNRNKDTREGPPPAHLAKVFAAFEQITFSRNQPSVKVSAVIKACEDFADRDLNREAARFRHYYVDGEGENRKHKDWVRAWRNWLERAPKATRGSGNRGATADVAKYDAKIRRSKAA